jgi:DNA-binding winged helix-turn-helix (wHTH) protein
MEKDPNKNEYIKTEFGKGYIFSKEVIRNKDSS